METAEIQQEYSNVPEQLKAHVFKKGQSGNPGGKPKGAVSLKVWARNYLQSLPDEDKLDFLEGINKLDIWKMGEGLPDAKQEHSGEIKVTPIYNPYAIRADHSNQESSTPGEEN